METTVKALAEEMAKALVTATREDGGEYVLFADSRPDWMVEVMREAHGDMLPDDHRYEMAREAVGLAAEADDEDEYRELVTEVEPPVYNADLCEWLSSHAARAEYVDVACAEYGETDFGIMQRISLGWLAEFSEVADLVWKALSTEAENHDTEDATA